MLICFHIVYSYFHSEIMCRVKKKLICSPLWGGGGKFADLWINTYFHKTFLKTSWAFFMVACILAPREERRVMEVQLGWDPFSSFMLSAAFIYPAKVASYLLCVSLNSRDKSDFVVMCLNVCLPVWYWLPWE